MSSFDIAIERFDAYNSQDPNLEQDGPREVVYARRMSECLDQFSPGAAEEVRLAARCQHIGRWQIPRNTYPDGKKGYLQWRNKLKELHAEIAEKILREAGYHATMVEKVKLLLMKKDLLHNENSQLLEDVVCLVFVKYYLRDFSLKHEQDKVLDILRKTFKKMSSAARTAAASTPLDDRTRGLLVQAAAT